MVYDRNLTFEFKSAGLFQAGGMYGYAAAVFGRHTAGADSKKRYGSVKFCADSISCQLFPQSRNNSILA